MLVLKGGRSHRFYSRCVALMLEANGETQAVMLITEM